VWKRYSQSTSPLLLKPYVDDFIGVWDLENGGLARKFEGHSNNILSLKVNGDGNTLVSVGKDKTLRLWDLRAWKA
jgi:WD40 repeat protein